MTVQPLELQRWEFKKIFAPRYENNEPRRCISTEMCKAYRGEYVKVDDLVACLKRYSKGDEKKSVEVRLVLGWLGALKLDPDW